MADEQELQARSMIELRWKKVQHPKLYDSAVKFPPRDDLEPSFWAVLQYRQTKPGLVVQGMEVFGETTDWQDVEISDD